MALKDYDINSITFHLQIVNYHKHHFLLLSSILSPTGYRLSQCMFEK